MERSNEGLLSDERTFGIVEPAYLGPAFDKSGRDRDSTRREILIKKVSRTALNQPPSLPGEPVTSYPPPIDTHQSGSMTHSVTREPGGKRASFAPGKTVRSSNKEGTQSSVVNLQAMQSKAAMKIDITTENKPLKLSPTSHEKVSNLTSDVEPPKEIQNAAGAEPEVEVQSSASLDVQQIGEDLLYKVQYRQFQINQKKAQRHA